VDAQTEVRAGGRLNHLLVVWPGSNPTLDGVALGMPALTFAYAISALACVIAAVRLLSRSPADGRRRGSLVGALLALACIALALGARNALIVQRVALAKKQVKRGQESLQQGKTKDAEEAFKRAAQLDPESKEARQELQDLEKARRETRQAAGRGTGRVSNSPAGAGSSSRPHPQRRESEVTITSYSLDVTIAPKEHRITGDATFTVRAKRGSLTSFEIALSPLCKIETMTAGGQPAATSRSDEWVQVTPKSAVTDRRDTNVRVRYTGFGKGRMLPAGDVISPEGTYLRPESRWCPAIGYLEFRSPVRVRITVPKGQSAVGPGVLVSKAKAPSGGTTLDWDCRENAMGVCIAAGPWVSFEGKEGDLPISVLLWKKHASEGPKLLAEAQRVVRYLTSLYGPFPYGKLAIAEIPFFPGGYSPSSMVLLGELVFDHKELIQKVLAHEIAHQWWGNLVLPQGPGAGWLAEGFAEYSSLLYLGHARGESAFRRALWQEKQEYHVLMQNPPEEPIIETDPFNQQGGYIGVVYQKGAYVLHMLRYVIGDQAFFAALRGFLDSRRYGIGTIADFRRETEQRSGRKLDVFFRQWLERSGTIQLTYDWQTTRLDSGRYDTRIVLAQKNDPPYQTPIDLQLVTAQGKQVQTRELVAAQNEYHFLTATEPRDIDIDPYDNLLLAVPKRAVATAAKAAQP